jgi:hypothetical protein
MGATIAIIYQMRFVRSIRGSYDRERDTFRYEILVAGSLVIAIFVHERISNRGPIHWLVEVCASLCRACIRSAWPCMA